MHVRSRRPRFAELLDEAFVPIGPIGEGGVSLLNPSDLLITVAPLDSF